jgi:hypothetical protein
MIVRRIAAILAVESRYLCLTRGDGAGVPGR